MKRAGARPKGVIRHGEASPVAGMFLRGLSLGALVGAAIAGSALLRRARDAGADSAASPEQRPAAATSGSDEA